MEFLKVIFIGVGLVFYLPIFVLLWIIKPILNFRRGRFYLWEEKEKVPWNESAEYYYSNPIFS